MKSNKSGLNKAKCIPILFYLSMLNGCLFETSKITFDGEISAIKLVRHDDRTAIYSVEYNGWSTVESLGVIVEFQSCKQRARFESTQLETICYTNFTQLGSEKTYLKGRFEGTENVTWTLDRGDSAFVQLQMFTKPEGTIGFSQRVDVQKQF